MIDNSIKVIPIKKKCTQESSPVDNKPQPLQQKVTLPYNTCSVCERNDWSTHSLFVHSQGDPVTICLSLMCSVCANIVFKKRKFCPLCNSLINEVV